MAKQDQKPLAATETTKTVPAHSLREESAKATEVMLRAMAVEMDPTVKEFLQSMSAKRVGVGETPYVQQFLPDPNSKEAEAWGLVETFDSRLTEAEKRIDRVLARLGVE